MDALSPSVSRTSSLRSQVKTLGSVLEERAKLVKRTLTGHSHVGRTCSTPTRSSLAACKFLKDTTTSVETCMQDVLTDLSNIAAPGSNLVSCSNQITVSDSAPVTLVTPKPKRQKYHSLAVLGHRKQKGSPVKLRSQIKPYKPATSPVLDNRSSFALESVKLERLSFKRGKGRASRDILWMQLTCALIKNLVNREPLQSDDLFKCRCLQMALRATKIIDPIAASQWLLLFSDRVIELVQDVEQCPFHTRLAKPHYRIRKLDVETAAANFSDDLWSGLLNWLRSARPYLLERLTKNIQLYA
ncbi:uncharacterized protein LOC111267067 isoform X2 [Varroa jacobsoni]|nr:uncharacterized protein LOC111267067 isoform X2 [Varroa jacobsoni]